MPVGVVVCGGKEEVGGVGEGVADIGGVEDDGGADGGLLVTALLPHPPIAGSITARMTVTPQPISKIRFIFQLQAQDNRIK